MMKHSRFRAWMLSAIAPVVLLAGCHSNQYGPGGTYVSASLCENNAFLKKYHCSLTAIEEAASHGDPDAQYALGYMYFYGVGTVRDPEAAMLWVDRAASQGQKQAKRARALMEQGSIHQPALPTHKPSSSAKSLNSKLPEKPLQSALPGYRKKPSPDHAQPPSSAVGSTASTLGSNYYTLQLMATPHFSRLSKFIDRYNLGEQASYFAARRQDKTLYVLVYGHYDSKQAAKKAVSQLPASLQKMHPWIRSAQAISAERKSGKIVG